jgi:hypothetical protein
MTSIIKGPGARFTFTPEYLAAQGGPITEQRPTMDKVDLIMALLEAAQPIIKAYHGDIRHDVRVIKSMGPESSLMWAPNPFGTYLVMLRRDGRPNIRAAESFNAMNCQYPDLGWHIVTFAEKGCDILAVEPDTARAVAEGMTANARRTPDHVSEIHL